MKIDFSLSARVLCARVSQSMSGVRVRVRVRVRVSRYVRVSRGRLVFGRLVFVTVFVTVLPTHVCTHTAYIPQTPLALA